MAAPNQAFVAIERHLGFPETRSRTTARSLQEGDLWPLGGPGAAPELDIDDVVSLIIALAVDGPLHRAAGAVRAWRDMTPGGADLTGAPDRIDTAGRALDIFADAAVHGEHPDLLRRDLIEVVSSWPEIVIANGLTGAAARFVPAGADAGHWQAAGHRKSTTLNGAALVDCLRELFGDSE
ncbi:hypothetical protein DPM33_32995 [Mesorhizobium hawassense]|uniref:Uncharacterized protein n=1 Tax=Mesorhizobium hawassense TaxID=1209954 RepID=A0A330H7V0_9HYPH|nr:hypothetical protein [Mesorhizobium hawassense]RAZ83202.1 hypothetical protein DPM33_32995 [Mesorhizobium hawassense]